MKRSNILLIICSLLMMSNVSLAADIEAGKGIAMKCMGCHGANGISSNPTAPTLAGKDIAYLSDKMKAYRDGSLPNPIMKGMTGGLSDSDIDNLASYYNSLPGE